MSEDYKISNAIKRLMKLRDKEKRLIKNVPIEKEHYVRGAPSNTVRDYYLGRFEDEDS